VAFLFACTFAGSWPVTLASIPVHILSLSLGAPLAMKAALMFPHGDPARGRLSAVWPWGFAVLGPLDASRAYGLPFSPQVGAVALPAASAAFLGAMLWALTVNYRRSDPIGRRRLKWNLLGVYVACAPPMAASAASVFVPGLAEYVVLSAVTLGLIPVFLLISILRYNLLDIDRLISVTASYTLLSVVLLAAFLTGVPTAARALSNSTGVESATTQAVLAVLVAAILVPLHGRLRPQIDRIFFTERWALQQGTGRLLKELAACRGAEALIAVLGDRLDRLLRPESCVVYGLGQGIFSPIFVRGKAVPPAFASGSAFVGLLRDQHGAIQTMDLASSGRAGALSHFDQAALEALGGPVALPMRQREELVAFVCLGPKGSGDIYTATDLALLTTVADRASLQLSGFDQEKVIRESLAMQEALRRYVPGELASRLESGRDLEVGEREVTILFVDIRGYSSYAEGRRPLEVFSTINRYTQAVSQLVHAHGGNVVEFNGDGMMAVFGAPGLLQDKERCALRAALAIVPAVEALRPEGAVPDDFALAVGLGIATGEVFVGSVRAADRLIWTAIGATTNLAARLQALTRELSAAVVIDAATWGKAGALAAPFQRLEGVRIRGLESPAELYALRPA
jgi:class 3 adenylate cyclase